MLNVTSKVHHLSLETPVNQYFLKIDPGPGAYVQPSEWGIYEAKGAKEFEEEIKKKEEKLNQSKISSS